MTRIRAYLEQLASIVSKYPIIILAVYTVVFAMAFIQIRSGVGQYWDWTFPVYKDQIGAYFQHASMSWNSGQMGNPLGYSSDYYFRFLVSLLGFMQPETVLYVVIAGLSAAGAYGVYLITKRTTKVGLAFVLGLAVYINPAIFYKLTAGHIDYYVSYTIFIYFIYFLLCKYKKSFHHVMILALLLGLVGVQIQFFVISLLFLVCFFLFHRQTWSWRYSPFLALIPLGLNWIWLSNFLFGGKSIIETSMNASKVSFSRASSTQFSSIFSFKFSDATLISHFFSWQALLCYTALLAILIFFLAKRKLQDPIVLSLLCFFIIAIFMATGLFQGLNAGPLNNIFPMFREVGHFAPIIVLLLILLLGRYLRSTVIGYVALVLIVTSVALTATQYQTRLQAVSFTSLRQQLAEFKSNDDRAGDRGQSRILSYPFFQPFALKNNEQKPTTLPLTNSGYDNLAAFSRQDYISNDMSPEKINSSLQYEFLTHNYNVEILQPYHVRYIYDMSAVYTSTYQYYSSPDTYPKHLQELDNDPKFLDKVIAANPGKVTKVSDHILEINGSAPIIHTIDIPVTRDTQADWADKAGFLGAALGNQAAYVPYGTIGGTGNVTDLFSGTRVQSTDHDITDSYEAKVDTDNLLFQNIGLRTLSYTSDKNTVRITQSAASRPKIDGAPVGQLPIQPASNITTLAYATHPQPLLMVNSSRIIPLAPNTQGYIGDTKNITSAGIYEIGENMIPEASFENGLWQHDVSDCDNYDSNPQIAMSWSSEHATGHHSLELRAKRHAACTFTSFPVSGLKDTHIFSILYKTQNATAAGYYLSFDDPARTTMQQFGLNTGDSWQGLYRGIQIPKGATKVTLYLYAFPTDEHSYTSVLYDNVIFARANLVTQLDVSHGDTYVPLGQPLRPGTHMFTYTPNNTPHTNLIKNGSFELGPWQPKVLDCDNYDTDPKIAQKINTEDHTDGHQSLELSATRHNACTSTSFNIEYLGKYHLSLDYKNLSDKPTLYYLQFDDPSHTVASDTLPAAKDKWSHFDKQVEIPTGATSATLWLYALGSDNTTTNRVRFDNVRFDTMMETQNAFSILTKPTALMQAPKKLTTTYVNSTEYTINAKSAQKQFILGLAENFHPGWSIYLLPIASHLCNKPEEETSNDHTIASCRDRQATLRLDHAAFAMKSTPLATTHLRLNELTNGWLIDPTYIKSHYSSEYYQVNADGSIDMNLMVYFKPQSYFYIGLAISGVTLAGTLATIYYLYWRSRKLIAAERKHSTFKIRPDSVRRAS